MRKRILAFLFLLCLINSASAEDARQIVKLPDRMKEHMLSNMRDHLLALEQITRNLADGQYEKAAEIAEKRLGMSSLDSHGASHMGQFMPKEMRNIGTNMHRAASVFSLAAKDAELEGDLNKAFLALSKVMQHCVACHSAYKIH
ncbi:MAG: hypothetical protein P8Y20_00485 [Gammaproteobacteria bacterium]|jgi:hypothetical protein